MLNIVPVAPEDKLEKNIEFGFEHELFEAEKIEQNNSFDNINSALIKTYGKKVFKLKKSIQKSSIRFATRVAHNVNLIWGRFHEG